MRKTGITDMGVLLLLRGAVCYTVPFLRYAALHKIKSRGK